MSSLVMGGLKTTTMCLLCSYIFLPIYVQVPLLESPGRAGWPQCVQLGLHMLLVNRRGGETRLAKETKATKGRRQNICQG